MANETEEWTPMHKGILAVVIIFALMLVAQGVRYFLNK